MRTMATNPPLSVDRSSPVPLYFQVAEQLQRAITDGVLVPGDRIANEIALADELGLSRPTMRQAIQTLVDKGLLVRKRGVGTQVVQSQIRRSVELTSLNDDLVRAGQNPVTRVLSLERVDADEPTARELQLALGAPVWRLERLRLVGDQPLALMANTLPVDVVDLRAVDLSETGLYEHLRRAGIHIRVAHQRIGATRADARTAKLLTGRKGDPLLTMNRTAFDDNGRAVEFGAHAYRPELYTFEMTLVDR
jgi:DNA-binding GntR family transcriptional regulator